MNSLRSFTIASKKLKYLRINLMMEVNDLYNENSRSLKKEINKDMRRWKDSPAHRSQNHYGENVYTTKSNLYVQCNPYQNFNNILHWDREVNLKVHMEAQKTSNSQSNSELKELHWRYHNS
jgi:hypothetical protein